MALGMRMLMTPNMFKPKYKTPPPKPLETGNKLLDLWYKAQWELACGEQPKILSNKKVFIQMYAGRNRAPTTHEQIQAILNETTSIKNQSTDPKMDGDYSDDENESEHDEGDDIPLLSSKSQPNSPKNKTSKRESTPSITITTTNDNNNNNNIIIDNNKNMNNNYIRLNDNESNDINNIGIPEYGRSRSSNSTPDLPDHIKQQQKLNGKKISNEKINTNNSNDNLSKSQIITKTKSIEQQEFEQMDRGEKIRKYWFMSQFQLKEGTHPTILNKFGSGYRISDLRKYNIRYKHIKSKSSKQFYLSLDLDNLTSKRNLIDKDEFDEDELPSPKTPKKTNSNSSTISNNSNHIQLRTSTTDSIPSQNGLSDLDEENCKH